jgi:hypothetical protein
VQFNPRPSNDSPESLHPTSRTRLARLSQWLKQDPEIVSIDAGRQIDRRDEQAANADSPKIEFREPNSNITVRRFLHDLKHSRGMSSISEGRQSDPSDEHFANADSPTVESLHPASKLRLTSFAQSV